MKEAPGQLTRRSLAGWVGENFPPRSARRNDHYNGGYNLKSGRDERATLPEQFLRGTP